MADPPPQGAGGSTDAGSAGAGGSGAASADGATGTAGVSGTAAPGGGSSAGRDAGSGGTRVDAGSASPPEAGTGGSAGTARSDAGATTEPAGIFVAVGYGGRTTRSIDDGHSWIDDAELVTNGGDDHMLLRTVTYGAGGFVALGYRSTTSVDGHLWIDHGDQNLNQWIGAVVYGTSAFVAVGGYGLRATSSNGITWTDRPIDTIASHEAQRLAYDPQGPRFVSSNDDGRLSYSADGRTWQFSTGTPPAVNEVVFGNGVFVGIGDSAVVVSSDGGVTWTSGPGLSVPTRGFVFAQGHFTAIGNGHVFTSADGTGWVDHPVSGITIGAIAYGHGSYVQVAGKSRRRSSDGLAWDAAMTSGTNDFEWVTFGATN